jgi:hypothetical protein
MMPRLTSIPREVLHTVHGGDVSIGGSRTPGVPQPTWIADSATPIVIPRVSPEVRARIGQLLGKYGVDSPFAAYVVGRMAWKAGRRVPHL